MVWIVIWLVGASFAVDDITTSPDDNTGAELLYIFFFISFYWTTQVISNIIHVTVAGVMATWCVSKRFSSVSHNRLLFDSVTYGDVLSLKSVVSVGVWLPRLPPSVPALR